MLLMMSDNIDRNV